MITEYFKRKSKDDCKKTRSENIGKRVGTMDKIEMKVTIK